MRFNVTVDEREHQVQTVGEPGTVILNGEKFEGTVDRPAKNQRIITIGKRRYEIKVVEGEVSEGRFCLELKGERIPVELAQIEMRTVRAPGAARKREPKKKTAKAKGDASALGIRAPMPGKVVEVFVETGEEGTSGATWATSHRNPPAERPSPPQHRRCTPPGLLATPR
jgi:acetyl/propionyl-CoA carboxylase alpha subunit